MPPRSAKAGANPAGTTKTRSPVKTRNGMIDPPPSGIASGVPGVRARLNEGQSTSRATTENPETSNEMHPGLGAELPMRSLTAMGDDPNIGMEDPPSRALNEASVASQENHETIDSTDHLFVGEGSDDDNDNAMDDGSSDSDDTRNAKRVIDSLIHASDETGSEDDTPIKNLSSRQPGRVGQPKIAPARGAQAAAALLGTGPSSASSTAPQSTLELRSAPLESRDDEQPRLNKTTPTAGSATTAPPSARPDKRVHFEPVASRASSSHGSAGGKAPAVARPSATERLPRGPTRPRAGDKRERRASSADAAIELRNKPCTPTTATDKKHPGITDDDIHIGIRTRVVKIDPDTLQPAPPMAPSSKLMSTPPRAKLDANGANSEHVPGSAVPPPIPPRAQQITSTHVRKLAPNILEVSQQPNPAMGDLAKPAKASATQDDAAVQGSESAPTTHDVAMTPSNAGSPVPDAAAVSTTGTNLAVNIGSVVNMSFSSSVGTTAPPAPSIPVPVYQSTSPWGESCNILQQTGRVDSVLWSNFHGP